MAKQQRVDRQGRALNKVAKRVAFRKCFCGHATLWKAYEPRGTGWKLWCYVCGRRDDACLERPEDANGHEVQALIDLNVTQLKRELAQMTREELVKHLMRLKRAGLITHAQA